MFEPFAFSGLRLHTAFPVQPGQPASAIEKYLSPMLHLGRLFLKYQTCSVRERMREY